MRRSITVAGIAMLAAWVAASSADPPPQPDPPKPRSRLDELNIRHRTEHYAIAGTVSPALFEEYGRALEYIHREYAVGFEKLFQAEQTASRKAGKGPPGDDKAATDAPGGKSAPAKAPRAARRPTKSNVKKQPIAGPEGDAERFRVIVFATDREYQEFGREFLGGWTEHTGGMYVPSQKMLLILNQDDREDTYTTLFHEAFHQFLCRYVRNPPTWLNEGLATHYGYAKPTPTGLTWGKANREFWDLCGQAFQFKVAISMRDVIHASRQEFYDTSPFVLPRYGKNLIRRQLYYAESYTLIHMLLKDKAGLQRLQNYIRDLAQDDGTNTAKITEKHFDAKTCERLSRAWAQYVTNRMNAR